MAQARLELPGGSAVAGEQGVDVALYRIPKPLEFLRDQRNLHRVESRALYVGDGAGQTLNYLYDRWTKETRRSWQRIVATPVREKATQRYPQLKLGKYPNQPSIALRQTQFHPIPGLDLVNRFRYPVGYAKPIAPPKDLKLDGSSSEFLAVNPGNVMVPLGRLKPGLYLAEAMLGSQRANTLVFISDTVAITKNASNQMTVWTTHRTSGAPVADVAVHWTDGHGVLQTGHSDDAGLVGFTRESPEHSYVIGSDPLGGVFVSENFYYDSEIYNAKLYAITDRPLYRPGDRVQVKFIGRRFKDARNSEPLGAANVRLEVVDPNGTPLLKQTVKIEPGSGGDASFVLPPGAAAGGWELRFALGADLYGAAFRVAEYVKPHFDIHLAFDKPGVKTGEPINGQVRLTYPNGKPVAKGRVSLAVRAQQATMVEGELDYAGQFPVKLEQEELATDEQGIARFSLPPARQPSRYVFTLLANDGAAYRVKVTRELLVERGLNPWRLEAPRRFSLPGEKVAFRLLGQGALKKASWEVVNLESQRRSQGALPDGAASLTVDFPASGSYTVSLRDGQGDLLGAVSHWVAGPGVKVTPGSIEIVTDKERYGVGDTAELLVTFPTAVDEALLTLERDAVEQRALLTRAAGWVAEAHRLSDRQWRLKVPVTEAMAPNMTLSVAYVKDGDYLFQNAGLVVAQPTLDIAVTADKPVYRPGETARLDLLTSFQGKPVAANLTLGVVDEMVYVLQPELAPSMTEFFYHVRRNNVRTTASLAFIGYDLAKDYLTDAPQAGTRPERAVKVTERPRRDDVDTAAWFPRLRTDAQGRVSVRVKVPDSLTRWRVTARGLTDAGQTGQRIAHLRSEKDLYLKWAGPREYRDEDEPVVDLVGFNRSSQPLAAELVTRFGSSENRRQVTLQPGPNFYTLPLKKAHRGDLGLQLVSGGQVVDSLTVELKSQPLAWPAPQQALVRLDAARVPIALPADARNVELSLQGSGAEHFLRVADDLIEYPYGCVEQTASRLIPLALAGQVLGDTPGARRLTPLLQAQRMRLTQLAGGDGVFGWWGRAGAETAFLTGYAYYADWFAARSLGITLPPENWQYLLEVYRRHGAAEPLLHRAFVLWWAGRMGLPVQTLALGLAKDLAGHAKAADVALDPSDSLVFAAPDSQAGVYTAALLLERVAAEGRFALPGELGRLAQQARTTLSGRPSPFYQALLLLDGKGRATWSVDRILADSGANLPTFERAMTLAWLHQSLGGFSRAGDTARLQPVGWTAMEGASGRRWAWPGNLPPAALNLARAPSTPVQAALRYTAYEPEVGRLPVSLTRRLYKLVPGDKGLEFTAQPVAPDEALSTNILYMDELTLAPASGQRLRYGLLEVPLPPGGGLEESAWGIRIAGLSGNDQTVDFAPAEHELGQLSYRIPVDQLDKPLMVRQLVRFQQRGQYVLPPARYFRMYQPGNKAFEGNGLRNRTWRVE